MADGKIIIEAGIETKGAEKDLQTVEKKVEKSAKNIEKTSPTLKVDANTDKADKGLTSVETKAKALSKTKAAPKVNAETSAAEADLARFKAQAKTLDSLKIKTNVEADTQGFDSKFSKVKVNLESFTKAKASAHVTADTATADANLSRMQAQLKTISQTKAKVAVNADTANAESKISKLKGILKSIVEKAHKVIVEADVSSAVASLASLNDKTKTAATGLSSMAKAVGIFSAISGALNVVKSSVSSAFGRMDTMKQFNRTVGAITGNTEAASIALDQLKEVTKGTSYGLDIAAKATQNFVTRGLEINKATDQVKIWGDAVAFYGKGTDEEFQNVTDALAKMRTKGTVEMDQLDRLFDAGIDAVGMYAQATGQSSSEVQDALSNGKISAADFIDTVSLAMTEGTNGVLGISGAAKEAGASWSGTFSNAAAACARGMQEIIEAIDSALTANGLPTLKEMIANLGKSFEEMAGKVAGVMPAVIEKLKWFVDNGSAVVSIIGAIAGAFLALKVVGTIASAIASFRESFDAVKGVTSVLGKTLSALGLGPIPIIIAAVAAFVAGLVVLYNTSETFRNAVNGLFSQIAASVMPILEQAKAAFSGLGDTIMNTLGTALLNLAPVFARLVDFISQMVVSIAPLIAQLVGSLAPVLATIVTVLMNVIQSIMPALGAILNVIMSVLEAVGPVVMNILSIIIDAASNIIQALSPVLAFIGLIINAFLAMITPIVTVIGDVLAVIIRMIGQILNVITGVFATIFGVMSETWTKAMNFTAGIFNKISGVISGLTAIVGTVFNGIYAVCSSVMDKVDGVIRTIFDSIRASWEGLTGFVDGIFSGVENAVNELVRQVKGFVNGVIGGINAAVGLINKIPGVTISEIPYLARGTDDFEGGFARINEGGRGELVVLPDGTQVIPHDVSMKYASEAAKAFSGTENQKVNTSLSLEVKGSKSEDASFIKGIAEDIDAEWQKVSETTTTKWQEIKTFMETTWAAIKENALNTASLMVQKVQENFTTMRGQASNQFMAMSKDLTAQTGSLSSTLLTIWQNTHSSLQSILTTMRSQAVEKMVALTNQINAEMGKLPGQMYTIGQNMMTELQSGIEASREGVLTTTDSLVTQLITKFKEGLGIHSPSRVMFSIGQYMVQGLINGLDGDNLLKFVDSMVGTIKDNFGNINLKQLISAMGSDVTKLWEKLGINFSPGAIGEGGMVWPTDSKDITSYFGGRDSPGGIGSTNHMGLDIGGAEGTPIYAAMPGTVTTAGWYGGYGNAVVIDHGGGMQTLYGHMSAVGTSVGTNVMPGQPIGFVGSTGNSTGPHLHFSVIQDGQWLDPLSFFPGFAVGSKFIPKDMLAMVHKGEAVVRKDENPHANSGGSFWSGLLQNVVNSTLTNLAGQFKTEVVVTIPEIPKGDLGGGDFTQNVYFQETPETPSEMRAVLKKEGRRLAFGL